MWTVIALFCEVANPYSCFPATPSIVFPTYEACNRFAVSETASIDLEVVTYDFQCVSWLPKV
jgi:hypothetical protein